MRIWYQSFIDPEVHAPYFRALRAHLAAIAGPGVEYEVAGIRPPDQALHRITEFRCAARAIDTPSVPARRGSTPSCSATSRTPACGTPEPQPRCR